MIDRYTKTVLTVIAAALTVLCVQNAVSPARAVSGECTVTRPCAVTNEVDVTLGSKNIPLEVRVVE